MSYWHPINRTYAGVHKTVGNSTVSTRVRYLEKAYKEFYVCPLLGKSAEKHWCAAFVVDQFVINDEKVSGRVVITSHGHVVSNTLPDCDKDSLIVDEVVTRVKLIAIDEYGTSEIAKECDSRFGDKSYEDRPAEREMFNKRKGRYADFAVVNNPDVRIEVESNGEDRNDYCILDFGNHYKVTGKVIINYFAINGYRYDCNKDNVTIFSTYDGACSIETAISQFGSYKHLKADEKRAFKALITAAQNAIAEKTLKVGFQSSHCD